MNSIRTLETIRILIAEDDDSFREIIQDFLKDPQRTISSFKNGKEAIQAFDSSQFDMVISDLMMPGADGMEVLRVAKAKNPDCAVILITGYASLDSALQAIRGGAYDYIRKPFKLDELEIVVKNACEKILLVRENKGLLQRLKDAMAEMERLAARPGERDPSTSVPSSALADQKVSELGVFLNQMTPPSYEVPFQEPRERTIQDLEKLIQLRKEGFIDALEYYSLKKMLLETTRD